MAFIPVPNVTEVAIRQLLHGQQVVNSIYFTNVEPTTGNYSNLLAAVSVFVEEDLYSVLSFNLTAREFFARDLTVADGVQLTFTPATPIPGAVALAALPGNAAACVSFRTGLTGRSRRGRNFIAGLPEAAVVGNTLDLALSSGIQGAYAGLSGRVAATGAVWVVVSRYSANLPRPAGIFTPVQSISIDPFVDSQRRRLTGRGI